MKSKASTTITLVLIGTMAVFFGFKSCIESDEDGSTTRPSGGSHSFWRSGGSSSGGSHFSGTSRGGFGGTGHSVGA